MFQGDRGSSGPVGPQGMKGEGYPGSQVRKGDKGPYFNNLSTRSNVQDTANNAPEHTSFSDQHAHGRKYIWYLKNVAQVVKMITASGRNY